MADNVTLNSMSGGDAVAADDIGGVKFQRIKLVYGADGTNSGDVTPTNAFPIAQSQTNFVFSTANSTSANLAASATFTGTVETVTQQQVISLLARADQPFTINVYQYQDGGGTLLVVQNTFTSAASTPFARSLPLNGNYVKVSIQNTGASTTTSLVLDTAYGTLPIATQSGNAPIALNEIGGSAFTASTAFADAESNTQVSLPAEGYMMNFNGSTWDRTRGNTTTGLFSGGAVAHGSSDAANPTKIGAKSIAYGANPTAVTAGQITNLYANRAGVLFVTGGHPNVQTVRLQFTAAQTNVAIVTVATGLKIVLTALQVTLDNASTVFPTVLIGFGTASTPTTTGVVAAHGGVPAGGGFSRGDGAGIIGIGADNEDLRITTTGVATGNGVEVVVTYYTIES